MVGQLLTVIGDEARRIWYYRWIALFITAVIFVGGAIYVLRLPNVYDAWGQLYVNKETPVSVAAQGVSLVGDNFGSPYVVQRTLLNDQNLQQVIKQIDPRAASMDALAMARAVTGLRGHIFLSGDQGDGFFELHDIDTDPQRARAVVQTLLNLFISQNVSRNRDDLQRASTFLDQQIADYEKRIAALETQIDAFRRAHPAVVTVTVPQSTIIAPAAMASASSPAAASAAPAAPTSPALIEAQQRVNRLQGELDELHLRFTDLYPDVVAVRRQLADAQAARDVIASALPPPAAAAAPAVASAPPSQPHVFARVRRQVAASVPPDVKAQWIDLQHSDEVLRAADQQLIAKRDATLMSVAVYGADGAGKYQLTRAPVTPAFPTGPNRVLLLGLAAVGAVGAGLAGAYLRGAIDGVFISPREVEDAFQLPVIGTVSWEAAWDTRAPRRRIPLSGPAALLIAFVCIAGQVHAARTADLVTKPAPTGQIQGAQA